MDLIERIDAWKTDFKGFVEALNLCKDDYEGIMEYIDEVPYPEREKNGKPHDRLSAHGSRI